MKLQSNIVCSKFHLQLFTNNANIVKKPPKLFGFKTPPSIVLFTSRLQQKKNFLKKSSKAQIDIHTHTAILTSL